MADKKDLDNNPEHIIDNNKAGTAPQDSQTSNETHRNSFTKDQTMHWFAQLGSADEQFEFPTADSRKKRCDSNNFDADSLDGEYPDQSPSSSGAADRVRLVRERQNEERQRRLEELRQHALSAQRFREQREEERTHRIEELRSKYNLRRSQAEERRKQMWDAVQERREAILRKHQQERKVRQEVKARNERSQIVFAFGSSTPRMLEPADTGGYLSGRRATSTSNVSNLQQQQINPLTRRSSERELDGSKKRATSAGGLERKPGQGDERLDSPSTPAGIPSQRANRRRTDLTPTLPSPRDQLLTGFGSMSSSFCSGRSSSASKHYHHQQPQQYLHQQHHGRSPGRTYSMSRLDQLSKPRNSSSHRRKSPSAASPSSSHLLTAGGGPLRRLDTSRSMTTLPTDARKPRRSGVRSGDVTPTNGPSRPLSAMSQQNTSVNLRPRTSPTITNSRRPRPASIAGTGVSSSNCSNSISTKTPTSSSRKSATGTLRSSRTSPRVTPKATPLQSPAVELPKPPVEDITIQPPEVTEISEPEVSEQTPSKEVKLAPPLIEEPVTEETLSNHSEEAEIKNLEVNFEEQCDMTASMIQKIRITTEEEAKAALAERRRLAREQAEREAEQERLRLEEEARLEAERLRKEEEEQKRLEEETLRLVQEARESEEQRLKLAIEEAKKREEEDRKRREEEAKQKLEKEEAERKAREEAEKQRLEMVERLKKEEEERNARRKRVEAIMSRTRAKNQASNPKSETEDSKSQELSPNDEVHLSPEDVKNSTVAMTTSQQLIKSEQLEHRSENGTHTNGHIETKSKIESEEFNGHHGNGLDESKISVDNSSVKQNNVTNNLLDLSDFDGLCNTNSNNSEDILLVPEDNINSNLNPTTISFTPMVPINVNNTSPFQEALTNNKPQENQLPDLLS